MPETAARRGDRRAPWPCGIAAVIVGLLVPLLAVSSRAGGPQSGCVASEPDGYRLEDFRAAVPCTLEGATVLDTEGLARLMAAGDPILVDVLPAPRRPAGLDSAALWLPPARATIPGSVWLPNVGFGVLPVEEERYLRENLSRLTGDDPDRPVVFFCDRDCWMSWNAARRAVALGHRAVHWFPGGVDDWRDAGRTLSATQPVPRGEGQ